MAYRKANKVVAVEELAAIVAHLKREGKRVVFTNGCFDLIHVGHTRYLEAARGKGDCLVVAVNSDRSVSRIKGKQRPIVALAERMEIVAGFQFIDYVTSFDDPDPYRIIKALKPNVLVKGGDWSIDRIVGKEIVEADGGNILTIPVIEGRSTSSIIEKIATIYRAR